MMTFPTEWKNNPNVPNHQPKIISRWYGVHHSQSWIVKMALFYHMTFMANGRLLHGKLLSHFGEAPGRRGPLVQLPA